MLPTKQQLKPWPHDAVMIVASPTAEVNYAGIKADPMPGTCRDCGAEVIYDSWTFEVAENLPSRLGRPILFFCVNCCLNYDRGTITELYDHRSPK